MPFLFADVNLDWGPLGLSELALRLGVATMLGGLVGLERERLDRAAGLRTHALVAVASALIMIVSTYGFPTSRDGTPLSLDPSRVAAQVVSGIGFLGAGVIIFRENTIRGLTTAATVWAVAGIGLASGGGLYLAAVVGTAFMLFIQAGLKPVERKFFVHPLLHHSVLIEAVQAVDLFAQVRTRLLDLPIVVQSVAFDRDRPDGTELIELSLAAKRPRDIVEFVGRLREIDAVRRVSYQRTSPRPRGITPLGDHDDKGDQS